MQSANWSSPCTQAANLSVYDIQPRAGPGRPHHHQHQRPGRPPPGRRRLHAPAAATGQRNVPPPYDPRPRPWPTSAALSLGAAFVSHTAGRPLPLCVPLMKEIRPWPKCWPKPTLSRHDDDPGLRQGACEPCWLSSSSARSRKSHVMDLVCDQGIALFAGLNAVPKRSYLAAYSSRVDRRALWSASWRRGSTRCAGRGCHAAIPSTSISTPCRPIPRKSRWKNTTFPAAAAVNKASWCSWPATPQPCVLAATPTPGSPKDQKAAEVLRFADFWQRAHPGQPPAELVFDSAIDDLRAVAPVEPARHQLPDAAPAGRGRCWGGFGACPRRPGGLHHLAGADLARVFRTPRVLDEP